MVGQPETREITFSKPTKLNENIIGVDKRTNTNFIEVHNPVNITRIILVGQPKDTDWELDFVIDGYPLRTIYSELMREDLPGPVYPGFPLALNPGMKQLHIRQTDGTVWTSGVSILLVMDGAM